MTSVASLSPVCGTKRGRRFDDDEYHCSPHSKRVRAQAFAILGSPCSPRRSTSPFELLCSSFPDMDHQTVSQVLNDCNGDMETALKQLTELSLANCASSQTAETADKADTAATKEDEIERWASAMCDEMVSAGGLEQAKECAKRFLVRCKAHIEGAQASKHQAEMQHVLKDNALLKRAVAIQHARMKDNADKDSHIQQLQQMLLQCQERIRGLESSNYSLSLHLKHATNPRSIMDGTPPDVY